MTIGNKLIILCYIVVCSLLIELGSAGPGEVITIPLERRSHEGRVEKAHRHLQEKDPDYGMKLMKELNISLID